MTKLNVNLTYVANVFQTNNKYFIDFKDHGHERPLYINVIRDPVEKFRSFYYFIRNGNLEGDGADVVMSEKKRLMTIDECVQNKVSDL